MKKIYHYLLATMVTLAMVGCSDDEEYHYIETDFKSFAIQGYENASVNIDKPNRTITVKLPAEATSGNNLTPVFTVSEGAQVSMNREVLTSGSKQIDFNGTVMMTVSDATYTSKTRWKINVTNNDYTSRYGLGSFLTASWSNDGGGADGFYMQQQHTGSFSNDNCGPTCAAMAAKWSIAGWNGSVEEARNYRKYSVIDGGTWWYPRDLFDYIWDRGNHNIYWWDFTGASYQGYVNTIIKRLEEGCLCISCLNMGNVREQTNKELRCDKYYTSGNGHYLLIKGYRIVDGVVWFEVHDPWGLDLKYDDGTYFGANRYYRALEVAYTIDWNIWTIVVPKA